MSLTGKTINQLPPISGYSNNTPIPVYKDGQTVKGTFNDLTNVKKWSALLTQTGPIVVTSSTESNGGLILNEIYTINNYVSGDNFSNIAQVLSGVINTTNCVFKVTGDSSSSYFYPSVWGGSELESEGGMVVTVLENTLGTDVVVEYPAFGDPAFDATIRIYPSSGVFVPTKTTITTQMSIPYDLTSPVPQIMTGIDRNTLTGVMWVFDFFSGTLAPNILNNTLVNITVYK